MMRWFLFLCPLVLCCACKAQKSLRTGAERMEVLLPLVQGKNLALVVNHTAVVGKTHLVDTLLGAGVSIKRIFAPEHGFRGTAEAGATIQDGRDTRTGLPIASLYGQKKKPSLADLEGVDLVVFDIQDAGARFYTYISTLHYVMEACAEAGKPILVLDRPNPNGHYVDGPVLDMAYQSFVGIAPVAMVHGCTMAELAAMFKGEHWIKQSDALVLSHVLCEYYTHQTPYSPPIPPSPNLPNTLSILLYPSICLFEGTTASLGRGTNAPFQQVGHPAYPDRTFSFTPHSMPAALQPPQQDKTCYGKDLRRCNLDSLRQQGQLDLGLLLHFKQQLPPSEPFLLENHFLDKLAGTDQLRLQIISGASEATIRASWEPKLSAYKAMRQRYLLYP